MCEQNRTEGSTTDVCILGKVLKLVFLVHTAVCGLVLDNALHDYLFLVGLCQLISGSSHRNVHYRPQTQLEQTTPRGVRMRLHVAATCHTKPLCVTACTHVGVSSCSSQCASLLSSDAILCLMWLQADTSVVKAMQLRLFYSHTVAVGTWQSTS